MYIHIYFVHFLQAKGLGIKAGVPLVTQKSAYNLDVGIIANAAAEAAKN